MVQKIGKISTIRVIATRKFHGPLLIGQTGRMVSERISEHKRDLWMQYFDKSAVAHAVENNHHISFDEARLIDRATNYWDLIRREALEIKLQPNNFNRDSGLHISKA